MSPAPLCISQPTFVRTYFLAHIRLGRPSQGIVLNCISCTGNWVCVPTCVGVGKGSARKRTSQGRVPKRGFASTYVLEPTGVRNTQPSTYLRTYLPS